MTGDSARRDERCNLRGARILVVDDSDINREIVLRMLSNSHAAAESAADGSQALEALEAARQRGTPFDLVLMDLQMPVMDGFEATRRIRADERLGKKLPVLALTASAMAHERRRCMEAGMNGILTKPFYPAEFHAAILVALGREGEPGAAADEAQGALPPDPEALHMAGLDARRVLDSCGGDRELYDRMVRRFREEARSLRALVRKSIEAGNREAAGRALHSLGGLAAYVGADEVREVAVATEESLRDGRSPESGLECIDDLVSGLLGAARKTERAPHDGDHVEILQSQSTECQDLPDRETKKQRKESN
jgi:CheY-like chemotaxis protein/HPt (histidine-containing phosphotransfer) domain-containing protein